MNPSGIAITQGHYQTHWLLTGVKDGIDLQRMSTADRRDFPVGVSGSHMASERETCLIEVPFAQPPPFSYILTFNSDLTLADYRSAGDANFSGQLYSDHHGYSQEVFIENSGEFAKAGCDGLLRYSAAAMKQTEMKEVFGLFPEARSKLSLVSIEPIGDSSPPVPIIHFDGTSGLSEQFYK